jgi:hypothetical protein
MMEAGLTNGYKIHWAVKLSAFAGSVVTLSWFFAGWRQVNEAQTLANWLLLLAGIVLTVLLLGLQGYWIYFEEKAKGTLRKRVELFERIYSALHGSPKG